MANWSSNHLPLFTLRYCVETNSPPVCGGEREEEGERIIILGCPVKTRDRASWKGQVQMDTIHLGDQEEVRSPRCSFWAWEDPFWLPSGFKCKRLQGRCHVSSQGLDSTPGSNLHAENSSAAGACIPPLLGPAELSSASFKYFGGQLWSHPELWM